MIEYDVAPEAAGLRLDLWLVRFGGAGSRAKAATWLERGKVFVNEAECDGTAAGRRLGPGDRVGVWVDRPGSARAADRVVRTLRAGLVVVHEDDDIVVIDKPVGLIVEPLPGQEGTEATVLDLLEDRYRHLPRARAFVVHRIDRDTSGLVLFARTPAARDHLKAQFERRTPQRVYLAVVVGTPDGEAAVWRDALAWDKAALRQRRAHGRDAGARDAEAHVRVRERFDGAALIEVSLVTGKRNQIRVQAALRGLPLLGERQYRFGAPPEPAGMPHLDRQALHAWTLGFVHPGSSTHVSFTAPLPDDLERVIERLRRWREPAAGAVAPATRRPSVRGRR